MLADEESPRVQDLKAIYPERFPGLDDAVMQWFLKMESRRAVITDQVIQEKARDIARELKIDEGGIKGFLSERIPVDISVEQESVDEFNDFQRMVDTIRPRNETEILPSRHSCCNRLVDLGQFLK